MRSVTRRALLGTFGAMPALVMPNTLASKYRKITQAELYQISVRHELWRRRERGGVQANLKGADLSGLCFTGIGLAGAILVGARLRSVHGDAADLRYANLAGADLRACRLLAAQLDHAVLCHTDLRGAAVLRWHADSRGTNSPFLANASLKAADFAHADLTDARIDADLAGSSFYQAKLVCADLSHSAAYPDPVDLRRANLTGACLRDVFFPSAALCHATIDRADLRGAYLGGADIVDAHGQNIVIDRQTDLTELHGSGKSLTFASIDDPLTHSDRGERP